MSRLVEQLRRYRDNRGMMADLRCILVESKRHRAWPALSRLGVDPANRVAGFVAGLYALHPEETANGNFGTTCRAIERSRGDRRSDDNKLSPTERRFQHLLAGNRDEAFERVMRMGMMAKSQGIPINYWQLENDLRFWSERTKTEWASSFWGSGAGMNLEEEA